ncbi:hypothetical protein NA57DRAFT_46823 [Rhizodiscina lignyota]|uniref:Xylanolytic transcriptional activator regulatory domain-containing protein n=1 Tax=Rhizodiscina lignyota TaxID=1504668 RepID=A0A9P4I8N0_9PEZI|nr:hypothetical protein NA57DRAFT_46823 [Rhizodiscina lignyota]
MDDSTAIESSFDDSRIPWIQQANDFGDFDLFIDSLSMPHTNNLSTFYNAAPLTSFSPVPLFGCSDPSISNTQSQELNFSLPTRSASPLHLFDEFSSSFPSFEPPSSHQVRSEPWSFTHTDWDYLLANIQPFVSVLTRGFLLPSRHTLSRYIATYFNGFHRHLPFLHLPTFSPGRWPVELILAVAAIGAQYSFDGNNAADLFMTSNAIIHERLRLRKIVHRTKPLSTRNGARAERQQPNQTLPRFHYSTGESPTDPIDRRHTVYQHESLQLAQTLLLLMAMATWGDPTAMFTEATDLQSTLANFVREEKLLEPQTQNEETWSQWVYFEGLKRTIGIIFCFFNFHTIVFNIPPPILNSELHTCLPSQEADWEAMTEASWRKSRRESRPEPQFQSALSLLFSDRFAETSKQYSPLGGYILILALIQHIYFLREVNKFKVDLDGSLSLSDIANVELALKNWQSRWEMDPESSLYPGNPQGPVSFNSTALLRMAYIRLHVDVGPWRALGSQDPCQVARNIHQSPAVKRNHKLTRAVLYSAHALSISVKTGVNIVARSQAFTWSLQHSLCALECAFVISKWLNVVQSHALEMPLDEEENRLLAYIVDMATEADPGSGCVRNEPTQQYLRELGVRVIRVWARLLSGEAIWNVVSMIGETLKIYSQILEEN